MQRQFVIIMSKLSKNFVFFHNDVIVYKAVLKTTMR